MNSKQYVEYRRHLQKMIEDNVNRSVLDEVLMSHINEFRSLVLIPSTPPFNVQELSGEEVRIFNLLHDFMEELKKKYAKRWYHTFLAYHEDNPKRVENLEHLQAICRLHIWAVTYRKR